MKYLKKFGFLVVAMFIMSAAFLTGCGKPDVELPGANDPVIGNGGLTVQKGNYLYYVNGYKSKSTLETINDNNFGNVHNGGIYRTKLSSNGKILKDEKGFLKETECIVPKLVGFEQGGFYIFGDKIFYLTPVSQEDRDGVLRKELTEIAKINLDGTKNSSVFKTENEVTSENIKFSYNNGVVSIVILDGSNLKYINGNNGKSFTIAENVTSFALGKAEANYINDAAENANEFANIVYYTRSATEDEAKSGNTGNVISSYNFIEKKENILDFSNETYTIEECKNGNLYYTKKSNGALYKMPLNKQFNITNEKILIYASYTNTLIADYDSAASEDVIVISDGSTLKVKNTYTDKTETIDSGTITILALRDGKVYYLNGESSSIYIANIKPNANGKFEKQAYSYSDKTMNKDMAINFDTDGANLFFYVSYKSKGGADNYYLNRINTLAVDTSAEFVGYMEEDHLPEEPENDVWVK